MASRKYIATRRHNLEKTRTAFIIATEGNTEKEYFQLFKQRKVIKFVNAGSRSNPTGVLSALKKSRHMKHITQPFEAWVVVDRNNWELREFTELSNWCKANSSYHCAISNPQFEFWLLLHFEDADGVRTQAECLARLKYYLKGYDKHIVPFEDEFLPRIQDAVNRAKRLNASSTNNCPPPARCTTVYRLVEKLLIPDT